jgi:protein-S-isoprenylcysteine O-methyltransferase Ste14
MDQGNSPAPRGPLPPAYLLGAILLMTALHLLVPGAQLLPVAWRLAGAIPVAAGVLLNTWADQLLKHAGTRVKPFDPSIALVLKGPFLFTRNPMYFGMVLILVGSLLGWAALRRGSPFHYSSGW